MQPPDEQCLAECGTPSTAQCGAESCGSHSTAPPSASESLRGGAQEDDGHAQGMGILLNLCQSMHSSPLDSKMRVLADSNLCGWTKHFSTQELTSSSAEYSIFCPDSGPFPGDGPAAYFANETLSGFSRDFNPFGADSPARSVADVEMKSNLVEQKLAFKRERDISQPLPLNQSAASDDAFTRRLLKIRQNALGDFLESGTKFPRNPFPQRSPENLLSNCLQESCCKTSDGCAPVADIYVPSVCECGTAIVGVWYRNRPYYTHWFRHPRYAALRCMLEQNRCKNKYRPACGIHASVGLTTPLGTKENISSESTSTRKDLVSCDALNIDDNADCTSSSQSVLSEENFGSVMSADELLAPKFMSLLCMFQLVKHLDAVGIIYPSTVPVGISPSNIKIEHVKISAHIDCERSKGFVQYRWYSTDINELADELISGDKNSTKVVGCCCLGHWKRKPPGRDSSKSTSQLIVNAALDVKNVYSPFELDSKRPTSLGLFDVPNISVIDWESLDHSVWATCKSLLLLPPEVIDASMKIPFLREKHVSHTGSIYCGKHCVNERDKKNDAESEKAMDLSMKVLLPHAGEKNVHDSSEVHPNVASCDSDQFCSLATDDCSCETSVAPRSQLDCVQNSASIASEHDPADQMIT